MGDCQIYMIIVYIPSPLTTMKGRDIIAKQQSCRKFIYKLDSKRLKHAKWHLNLPLQQAMRNKNDIVALNDSQLLRWICEINGVSDLDERVSDIQKAIKLTKAQPKSKENKMKIKSLYEQLYALQYQKDYFCMIMKSDKDYDRANQGFSINGIKYRRLLGTNGGIKRSTITYVSENVYSEVIRRMDCGRDKTKEFVPAKLEAYQALICSGSIPVTMPRMIVVDDCNVKFTEDVYTIMDDSNGGEPKLEFAENYEIEYCDSDGYGFMSPEYSRIVNKDLYPDDTSRQTISGINTRYAWTKGMLFTFDFVEFAKQVNGGDYIVKDAWGMERDVRDFDVILTTSMVKLWDSYESLEHFKQCCDDCRYQFSVAKTTGHKLENARNANYQFLQTYELDDSALYQLCKPTINEIQDVLGGDWRRTIVFLKGMFLDENNVDYIDGDFIKALMIDKRLMDDPFVLHKIHAMIHKRIDMSAKGSIKMSGNFAIVSGDLCSLAQSIFGLPVAGLLKPGEVYHKYWIDRGVEEIAVFRAPMTCHNNIRKRKVVHNEQMDYWYQYNTCGIILNSWDTTCDALNGADKDSDTFFTTDNPIVISHTRNSPTIKCMQRKAAKVIPNEKDMVTANKLAFGDEIGTTTNHITAMIERQTMFPKGSAEYEELDYRIKCGQHYQQCAIDKAKGILANSMPKYWYSRVECKKLPEDTEEQKAFKHLCLNIVAENKPYFMKYVYPDLMERYNKYLTATNKKCRRTFKMDFTDLLDKPNKTLLEKSFIEYYQKLLPVGDNPCLVNRIAWLFEDIFHDFLSEKFSKKDFDYTILKSGVEYSRSDYSELAKIKAEYDDEVKAYQEVCKKERIDKEESSLTRSIMLMKFKAKCDEVCPDDKELCDILIDMCYSTTKSKQFVWDMCSDTIIQNLLRKNNYLIHYPTHVESDGDFEFGGEQFVMKTKNVKEDGGLLF